MNGLFAKMALLPEGWVRNVALTWDDQGLWDSVNADSVQPNRLPAVDVLLPGVPNLHSHAFQRAMAGLTEYRSTAQDSFWSWRTLMYDFAQKLSPDLLKAVAAQLYLEMLQAGYTSVCEFHYVHHDRQGQPYASADMMARCLIEAADEVGIGMTLLPVMYQYSGFGQKPFTQGQARFINSPEWILNLLEGLQRSFPQHAGLRYGVAPHSLRAVSETSLRELIEGLAQWDRRAPIHIHIAEQLKEVEDCLAHYGARPVEWLMSRFDVDSRWCLIHATHMTPDEVSAVARSGAVVGICPSTEANLGDGIFEGQAYQRLNGRWGIGSDSNVTVDVAEELRSFEYSQRLQQRQRNVLASDGSGSVGAYLYREAVKGGAQSSGRPVAGLAVGQRADGVVLDMDHADLFERQTDRLLDSYLFCRHGASLVRDVLVGGRWRILEGRHVQQESVSHAYRSALTMLLQG